MSKSASGFGHRLRELRTAAGLTQMELAVKADLHLGTVTKLEQGLQEPTWPKAQALARALGVSLSAFDMQADAEPTAAPPAARSKAAAKAKRKPRAK